MVTAAETGAPQGAVVLPDVGQCLSALRFRLVGAPLGGSTKSAGRSSSCVTPTMWWRDLSMKDTAKRPLAGHAAADGKVCAIAAPGQDATDRVWPLCGLERRAERGLGKPEGSTFLVSRISAGGHPKSRFSPLIRKSPPRSNAGQDQEPSRKNCDDACTTPSRNRGSGARQVVRGYFALPRRANQPPQSGGLSVLPWGASG